jgi:hypothetical protein
MTQGLASGGLAGSAIINGRKYYNGDETGSTLRATTVTARF